ncbi:MAG: hypothetical protein JWR32_3413 [Mycobacterium sp.]|nr:hypothetical protein [Mycobacterium sp.]
MTTIEHGRLLHTSGSADYDRTDGGHRRIGSELAIAAVFAAWAIVLLCGYIFGAVS